MCGAAITEFPRDFCHSIVTVGPVSANITNHNKNDLGQYNEPQLVLLPTNHSRVVVSCSVASSATETTYRQRSQLATIQPVTATIASSSLIATDTVHSRNTLHLDATVAPRVSNTHRVAESEASGARNGRRTVRRELERRRRSLHAAGVEDLRRMLLPATKSGPVSITQVLQEAVRVVLVAKAEERGALHAKEFLREKRSYLQAKLANIKCGLQPIDDDKIIKTFINKVRKEQRALRRGKPV